MGHYYLAGWRYNDLRGGERERSFTVDLGSNIEDWMGGGHTVLDLSPTNALASTDGLAFVCTELKMANLPSTAVYLGDSLGGQLPEKVLRQIRNRFSTTFVAEEVCIDRIICRLVMHGRDDLTNRWNIPKPSHGTGRSKIVFAGETLHEWDVNPPRRASIAVSDNFTYTNGNLETTAANWDKEKGGTIEVISNRLDLTSGGLANTVYIYNADSADTDDEYCELDVWSSSTTSSAYYNGPVCRIDSGGGANVDGYIAERDFQLNDRNISRLTAGSISVLDTTNESAADTTTATYRVEAEGSTIRSFKDGSGERSVTDSNHSGATHRSGGVYFAGSGGPILADNWAFGDIETAITVNVGLVTETDSGQSHSSAKSKAPSIVVETDSVLASSSAKALEVGPVTETNSALALITSIVVTLGLVSETDSTLSPTSLKTFEVGLSSEADSVLATSIEKLLEIGLATETDSVLDLISALTARSRGSRIPRTGLSSPRLGRIARPVKPAHTYRARGQAGRRMR